MKIEKKRLWPLIVGTVGMLVVMAGVVWAVICLGSEENKAPEVEPPISSEEESEPEVVGVGGKMLFTGNIFWGRRTNALARASELGVAYPFSGLYTLEREKYTDWIGGLECPVTDKGGVHDYNDEYNLLKFNCDPDYLPEFAKWFTAVSLGNNHTDNQGAEGFLETAANLTGAGVQWFGHYNRNDTEDVCRVVAVNVNTRMSDGSVVAGKLPMGMCGHHGVFGVPSEASLAKIAEYAEVMPVVAMPHMGAEYKEAADSLRESVYRKMIDHGAEMVMGDHPHWVQNTEVYNGRLIVYSMGNFMFDQDWNEEVRRSAAIGAGFSVSGEDVGAWMDIAEACAEGGLVACKGLAETAGLEKYGVEWEFEAVATENVNMITTRAGAEIEARVMERLGWGKVMEELGR